MHRKDIPVFGTNTLTLGVSSRDRCNSWCIKLNFVSVRSVSFIKKRLGIHHFLRYVWFIKYNGSKYVKKFYWCLINLLNCREVQIHHFPMMILKQANKNKTKAIRKKKSTKLKSQKGWTILKLVWKGRQTLNP